MGPRNAELIRKSCSNHNSMLGAVLLNKKNITENELIDIHTSRLYRNANQQYGSGYDDKY